MYPCENDSSANCSLAAGQILDVQLPGWWIGRRVSTHWIARSPDFSVLDFPCGRM